MQFRSKPLKPLFNDAVFVAVDNPLGWYEKHVSRMHLPNVSFLVFQVEHCPETDALCLRGFVQSVHLKTSAKWCELLNLGSSAIIEPAPGTATLMARQCMTAGVDVFGRRWRVFKPHVVYGTISIRVVEQMCLDVIDGASDSELASRYPRPWKHYRRSVASLRRILDECPTENDLECAARGDMIPIVFDICVHRDSVHESLPVDPNSFLK